MKIVVASKNPVKLQSTEDGFKRMFAGQELLVEGVSVPSGVADQPMSDEDTLTGAMNRAANARQAEPEAEYWVGIEAGLEERDGELEAFAWVVVLSGTQTGRARTGSFFLPHKIAELIHQGYELGEADDVVFGYNNSKQKTGAVGILTGDVVTRTSYYAEAVCLALVPFRNEELY